jgi:hypothetical protein
VATREFASAKTLADRHATITVIVIILATVLVGTGALESCGS